MRTRRPPSLGPPKHLLGLAPLAPRRAFPYRSPRLIRPATGQGSQGMDSGRGGWRILRTATACGAAASVADPRRSCRSEEHTSELQSLMRISYAVFCLKKKKKTIMNQHD